MGIINSTATSILIYVTWDSSMSIYSYSYASVLDIYKYRHLRGYLDIYSYTFVLDVYRQLPTYDGSNYNFSNL